MTVPWLTDQELREATHRKMPSAQARALQAIGVPFKRRLDGTLLVGRDALASVLSGSPAGTITTPAANGLNGLTWSKHA